MGNKSALVLVVVGVASFVLWANNATVADGRSVLKYIVDGVGGGQVAAAGANPNSLFKPGRFGPMPVNPDNLPTLPLPGQIAPVGGGLALYPMGAIWGVTT